MRYVWQGEQRNVYSLSISDFAGCKRTAKSISEDAIMQCRCYIKIWNSTHYTVALIRGEEELTAVVECSCETIGCLVWWSIVG